MKDGASGPGRMRDSGTALKLVRISKEMKGFPSVAASFFCFIGEESRADQTAVPQNRRLLPQYAAAIGSVQEEGCCV